MAEPETVWYFVFELVFHDNETNEESPCQAKMQFCTKDEKEALEIARENFMRHWSHANKRVELGLSYCYPRGGKILREDSYEKEVWNIFFVEPTRPTLKTPWQKESAKVFYAHSPE